MYAYRIKLFWIPAPVRYLPGRALTRGNDREPLPTDFYIS